ISRLGGNEDIKINVRIIAASNENLQEAVKKGEFREDLYHRLNEFQIHIPPLRERKKDIPIFSDYFLKEVNKELNKNITVIDKEKNVPNIDLKETALIAEIDKIIEALEFTDYNKTKAAKMLNIDRKTLYNKLKEFEIDL